MACQLSAMQGRDYHVSVQSVRSRRTTAIKGQVQYGGRLLVQRCAHTGQHTKIFFVTLCARAECGRYVD